MAILLKEQLKQSLLIKEVSYRAPKFDKTYYETHSDYYGKNYGKRMFYDFYAIDQLWRAVGSGKYSKAQRDVQRGFPEEDPRKQYHSLMVPGKAEQSFAVGGDITPEAMTRVVDKIHAQVVGAVADNLLSYLNLAVVQEFRYFVGSAYNFNEFRNSLLSKYNIAHTLPKREFNELINLYIPKMKNHKDVVFRLLKYCKYYSEMKGTDQLDPYDISQKSQGEPEPEEPGVEEPSEPEGEYEPKSLPMPGEPDDTDYVASQEPPDMIGQYGGEDQPESPYNEPWSGLTTFKKSKTSSKKKNKEKPEDLVTEVNTGEYSRAKDAIDKAGMTLEDIKIAYNDIRWSSGGIGGARWGDITDGLIKLIDATENQDIDEVVNVIDYIYDLHHNTSLALNKGAMNVDSDDLNRRYRLTHPARYLPFVSPIIRQLLVRYMEYFYGTDVKLELDKEKLTKTPGVEIPPEDLKWLKEFGFELEGYTDWMEVPISFTKQKVNKEPETVYQKYHLKRMEDGKYFLFDDYHSDIRIFDDFDSTKKYIKNKIGPEFTPEVKLDVPTPVIPSSLPPNSPSKAPSASATPSLYKVASLPPNSPSNASYNAHAGITTPPNHTIRLTKEDEDSVKSLGFEPKFIGGNVWYIHKTAKDTIKFYPNDKAKILFAGKSAIPFVNFSIEKMLAWLPTKYSDNTKTSPLYEPTVDKPASGGVKAGPMFEKYINNAGLTWNPETETYRDNNYAIRIFPYPISTVTNLETGLVMKVLQNLPALVAFLTNEFISIKNS